MATYTYTIFDANPNSSGGGTAWPTHTDTEIEADSDDEALNEVRDVMGIEAAGLNADDGYVAGQRLYAIVWDSDTCIVGEPIYELTAEDLGIEAGIVIDNVEAVNESTVVALARECEVGSIIAHDLADSLGDDGMAELTSRLARRGLKLSSTDRGVEVAS